MNNNINNVCPRKRRPPENNPQKCENNVFQIKDSLLMYQIATYFTFLKQKAGIIQDMALHVDAG